MHYAAHELKSGQLPRLQVKEAEIGLEMPVQAADVTKCTNMTECAGYEPRQARYGPAYSSTRPNISESHSETPEHQRIP